MYLIKTTSEQRKENYEITWQSSGLRPYKDESSFLGFRVSRVRLTSGKYHYYVHWFENVDYASPHWKMSNPFRTLNNLKKYIWSALYDEPNKHARLVKLKIVK